MLNDFILIFLQSGSQTNNKNKTHTSQRGHGVEGMRSCNPFNPFPGSARVFCLFYMKGRNRLHSEHIFFKDTVILYYYMASSVSGQDEPNRAL